MKNLTIFSVLSILTFAQCTKDYTDGEVSETDAFPIVHYLTYSFDGADPGYEYYEYDFLKRAKLITIDNVEQTFEYDGNRIIQRYIISYPGGGEESLTLDQTLVNGLISEELVTTSYTGDIYRYVYFRAIDGKIERIEEYKNYAFTGHSFYEYDNKGNRIRITFYDPTGFLSNSITYDPDYSVTNTIAPRNFGQWHREPWQPNPPKLIINYDQQGNETSRNSYEYHTDNRNIISSTAVFSNSFNSQTRYTEYFYQR